MPLHFKLPYNHSLEASEWADTVRELEPIVERRSPVPDGESYDTIKARYDAATESLIDYLAESK